MMLELLLLNDFHSLRLWTSLWLGSAMHPGVIEDSFPGLQSLIRARHVGSVHDTP